MRQTAALRGPNFALSKAQQIGLRLQLQARYRDGGPVDRPLTDFGYRVFSQHDEDGIVQLLLALLGETSRIFVEIGCGNGIECNTANLSINHAWHGLLVDGRGEQVEKAGAFYREAKDTRLFPPRCRQAMVEPDTVNDLLRDFAFHADVDLLSIDIDGVDWWVWEAVEAVTPRIVIVETPPTWAAGDSFTIPWSPGFVCPGVHYYGASHLAFQRLGARKGYRLVGTNRYGTNCFFLRDDASCQDVFPAVDVADCLVSPRARSEIARRRPLALQETWVEVMPDGRAGA